MKQLNTLAPILVAASAVVMLLLGLAHLWVTFHGPKLLPRDTDLMTRMSEVSPVIARETTMWKCWIGFNASHSFGLILFATIFGYLSLWHSGVFFHSTVLQLIGLAFLSGFIVLGKLYWFSIPFRGIILATALYVIALLMNWV